MAKARNPRPPKPLPAKNEIYITEFGVSTRSSDGRLREAEGLVYEELFKDFSNGATYKQLSEKYGKSMYVIHHFMNLPCYKSMTEAAKEAGATWHVEAVQEILDVPAESMVEVKDKELKMKYHMWCAEKKAPKLYGNKREIEIKNVELSESEKIDRIKQIEEAIRRRSEQNGHLI